MSGKSVNPLTLARPKSTTVDVVWEGKDANDGASIKLRMKPMTLVDSIHLPEKTAGFVVEYVTGGAQMIDGKEQKTLPKPIAPLGGETVAVTEGVCQIIAVLMLCQVGDPDELFSFQEWAHILCIREFEREAVRLCYGKMMTDVLEDTEWLDEGSTDPLASTEGEESASSPSGRKSSEPTQKSPTAPIASSSA